MTFWSGETLAEELPGLIEGFEASNIDCNAYTLRVGHEAYITPDYNEPNPLRCTAIPLTKGETDYVAIPPGQFGFLITEERIKVPKKAMAFISLKSTFKLQGLINASGFHVDPGYEGRLVFSVFNAGPRSIHVKRLTPLFLIWYADHDNPITKFTKKEKGHDGISPRLLNGISGTIQSAHGLSDRIAELERTVKTTKTFTYAVLLPLALALVGALIIAILGWQFPGLRGVEPQADTGTRQQQRNEVDSPARRERSWSSEPDPRQSPPATESTTSEASQ